MRFNTRETAIPTKKDKAIAQKSLHALTKALKLQKSIHPSLKIAEQQVELPLSLCKLVVEMLNQMAEGHTVTITSSQKTLSTQEAADLLNVSRPYFVKLLESDQIPFTKVGNRRRVNIEDVQKFKKRSLAQRRKILQKLVDQAQELDMGY